MTPIKYAAMLLFITVPALASAGTIAPFDAATFDALTRAGRPVIVVVRASWCPTCQAQKPIQTELMHSPEFKNYTMFIVDFDRDTAVLKRFNVLKQSTIIVFKGQTEVGRSLGDTTRTGIAALFKKANA